MLATIASRPFVIVLLDSVGKYTRLGDAQRVKHWLETGEAMPAMKKFPTLEPAPVAPARAKPIYKGTFPPRVAKYVESLKQVKLSQTSGKR